VDRFHFSTRAYQLQTYSTDYPFRWLEQRLSAIGFHLVFCYRTPESFATARAERLKISGNPAQYDDLGRFVTEQEEMRFEVARSRLPSFEVDVSDGDVAAATERVADWLEATGGLTID
jgi:hypothetical protein